MPALDLEIITFYQRWHQLEPTLGADAGSVLDFDLSPAQPQTARAYSSRMEALDAALRLRDRVRQAGASTFHNAPLIGRKLDAAVAYLRALMGERPAWGEYMAATMGIRPQRVAAARVADYQDAAARALSRQGYSFDAAGAQRYRTGETISDLSSFEPQLRAEAARWVARLGDRLGLDTTPLTEGRLGAFTLSVAEVDAYWTNWIDGSLEAGIRLRVNTHPRISYIRSAYVSLAAHEIAGHAAHALTLLARHQAGQLDGCALSLTVHGCEAFHMEGLAQSVVHLVAEPEELPPGVVTREALSDLHNAIYDNAHLDMESGRPVEEVLAEVLSLSPFLASQIAQLNLRDRGRGPLYRCYQAVYGPSRRCFQRARALPRAERWAFAREMYEGLYTPWQIEARLQALLGDGDPDPAAALTLQD